MKTMTEQECRAFVMSGYIPTSNDDVADIQDCFNHQSVDFQIGLLLDVETHANAERFMRISSTIIPNTLFQLRHWDMIEICMDLGDFVRNGDWSPTLVKKVNAFIDQVSEILASDEFKNDTKVVQLISKIQSKNLKQQHESITKPQD